MKSLKTTLALLTLLPLAVACGGGSGGSSDGGTDGSVDPTTINTTDTEVFLILESFGSPDPADNQFTGNFDVWLRDFDTSAGIYLYVNESTNVMQFADNGDACDLGGSGIILDETEATVADDEYYRLINAGGAPQIIKFDSRGHDDHKLVRYHNLVEVDLPNCFEGGTADPFAPIPGLTATYDRPSIRLSFESHNSGSRPVYSTGNATFELISTFTDTPNGDFDQAVDSGEGLGLRFRVDIDANLAFFEDVPGSCNFTTTITMLEPGEPRSFAGVSEGGEYVELRTSNTERLSLRVRGVDSDGSFAKSEAAIAYSDAC